MKQKIRWKIFHFDNCGLCIGNSSQWNLTRTYCWFSTYLSSLIKIETRETKKTAVPFIIIEIFFPVKILITCKWLRKTNKGPSQSHSHTKFKANIMRRIGFGEEERNDQKSKIALNNNRSRKVEKLSPGQGRGTFLLDLTIAQSASKLSQICLFSAL